MYDFAQRSLPFPVNRSARRRLARLWTWATTSKKPLVRHVHIRQTTEVPAKFWGATRLVWNMLYIAIGLSLLAAIFNAWLLVMVVNADRPELWQALRQGIGNAIDRAETDAGLGCVTWTESRDDGDPRQSYQIERSDGPACRRPPAGAIPGEGRGPVPPAPDAPPATSEGNTP